MENLNKPMYGILDHGMFNVRIVSGLVTGIRYTEDKPVYEISFGKDKWWTSVITDKIEEIPTLLGLASLDRIKETHGLKIKFNS